VVEFFFDRIRNCASLIEGRAFTVQLTAASIGDEVNVLPLELARAMSRGRLVARAASAVTGRSRSEAGASLWTRQKCTRFSMTAASVSRTTLPNEPCAVWRASPISWLERSSASPYF
jgi:hypothetical protein